MSDRLSIKGRTLVTLAVYRLHCAFCLVHQVMQRRR